MNEDDVEVDDDAAAADGVVDVTGAELQNASDGQVKTIFKLAMMAGSKKKEAVELMKNLIGISEEQERYVFDELARMAKTPKARNPYKRGRPSGQTNREGHNAGRPSNSSKRNAAAAAAAMFEQRTVRQRTDCSSSAAANETAASASIDQQQATEAAQAAAAVKSAEEKKRYDRAIEKIEHYVASVPNGSFTATFAEVDDDDEGLDLDVDSDDEGGEDEQDGASAKRKRRCYKPKSNSAIRSYLEDILVKVKNRHISIDYGTCWIPPRNPLRRSLGKTAAPDEFYVSKAWVLSMMVTIKTG